MEIKTKSFTVGKDYSDPAKAVKAYRDLKMMIADLEAEVERLKTEVILPDMMGAEVKEYKANGITFKVANKVITSTRVDTKAIKAKYPAIAVECSVTSTSPRFIVK